MTTADRFSANHDVDSKRGSLITKLQQQTNRHKVIAYRTRLESMGKKTNLLSLFTLVEVLNNDLDI
jgi:hypothetical protein